MGSRGNIYITSTAPNNAAYEGGARGCYVYSHWSGYELPSLLQDALRHGRDRWADDQYLPRIIIDQVTKADRDSTTGSGVSLEIGDNSYPITVVDLFKQTVSFAAPGNERDPSLWQVTRSFAEYVTADQPASYPSGVAG